MRGLWRNDLAISNHLGLELREDGQLGSFFAKRFLDLGAVTREGPPPVDPVVGTPFLCTWPAAEMFVLDRKLPRQRRSLRFAAGVGAEFTSFIGNGVFIGDGFVAGIVSSAATIFAPAKIAPILVRVPSTPHIVEASTYLNADGPERKRMSVLLPAVDLAQLTSVYVVPLGWQDETARYAFALVSYEQASASAGTGSVGFDAPITRSFFKPRVWIGNTGQMTLTERPEGLGLDWAWGVRGTSQTIRTGPVTCTGPGRLEFVLVKPESNEYTVASTPHGTVHWIYNFNRLGLPSVVTGGLPIDSTIPASSPASGTFLFGGEIDVDLLYETEHSAVERRGSVFIARSSDFGQTWQLFEEPGLASTSTEFPATAWGSAGPTPDLPVVPSGTLDMSRFLEVRNVYLFASMPVDDGLGHITIVESYAQELVLGPFTSIPTPPPSTGNRGPVYRPEYEAFSMVNAGSMTFMVVAEYLDSIEKPSIAAAQSDFGDSLNYTTLNRPELIRTRMGLVPQSAQRYTLRLFRRIGLNPFVRIPWPGDALIGETHPGAAAADAVQSFGDLLPPSRISAAWAGLGEGRAALLVVQRNAAFPYTTAASRATVIGTTDGGLTWASLEVESADEFRQWCVVGADGIEKHPTIVYCTNNGSTRQLMRVSADFAKSTPYGKEYPAGRGGLVNFKRYVHPAFPGDYDQPTP